MPNLEFILDDLTHNVNVTLSVTTSPTIRTYTVRPDGRHSTRIAIPQGNQYLKNPVALDIPIQTRVVKRDQYPSSMAQYEIQRYQNNQWQFLYPVAMSTAMPLITSNTIHDCIFHDHRLFILGNNGNIRWFTEDLHEFIRPIHPDQRVLSDLYPLYHYGEQYSDDGKFGTRRLIRHGYLNTNLEPAFDKMHFLRSQLLYPLEPTAQKGKIPPECNKISLHINRPDFIEILLASDHDVYSLPLTKKYGFFVADSDPFKILTIENGTIIQI